MTCFHPMQGYYSKDLTKNGKRKLVFASKDALADGLTTVTLACGRCSGCLFERSRQWSIRCLHENSMHNSSCFLTLTYDDDNLPLHGTLVKKHVQDFMKRFRRRISSKIRYYYCGEYGEKFRRPHYHLLIFGYDFDDKILHTRSNGIPIYISPFLSDLWKFGYSSIGDVTFQSAGYVARYVMKKVTGDRADAHYLSAPDSDGVCHPILPEFTDMSRRPGIGKTWFDANKDSLRKDFLTVDGKKHKPPLYYDALFEIDNPEDFEAIKQLRNERAALNKDNNTRDRLLVREHVFQQNILNKLPRNLE